MADGDLHDLARVTKVEDELFAARMECKQVIANFEGFVDDMVTEVDALMEIVAAGSPDKLETVIPCKGAPIDLSLKISKIKSKMRWLREEVRHKLHEPMTKEGNPHDGSLSEEDGLPGALDNVSCDDFDESDAFSMPLTQFPALICFPTQSFDKEQDSNDSICNKCKEPGHKVADCKVPLFPEEEEVMS